MTWAYRHPDPESMRDEGVGLGPVRRMSRDRPDGSTLRWRLSDPMALPAGGVIPFVIDWDTTPHPSTTLPDQCVLLELLVSHPDADRLQPILDSFRPVLSEPDGGILIVAAPEPRLQARLRTPMGEVELS